jgi:hypothetical protein
MFESAALTFALAGLTAGAILLWPRQSAATLLALAPILWAFGAAAQEGSSGFTTSTLNLAMVIAGIATVMYAPSLFRHQDRPAVKHLQTAAIIYCLALLPSVLLSSELYRSFGGYVRLISPVILMFALFESTSPKGARSPQFKAFAIATVFFICVLAAAQFMGGALYVDRGIYRLKAFSLGFQHISLFSIVGTAVLACGMALGRHRALCATGILILVVCTYLTGYRTAWIGMAVVIGLSLVMIVRSPSAKFVVCAMVLLLMIKSASVLESLARYDAANSPTSNFDAITSGRLSIDSIALDRYVSGSPSEWLFGIGILNAQDVTREWKGDALLVHSDFLATLIESGVVGFAAYVFFLFSIGRLLLHARRSVPHGHPSWTFLTMSWVLFLAFVIMGIASALYGNVFIGWYYYGFLGLSLAQLKSFVPQKPRFAEQLEYQPIPSAVFHPAR